MASILIAWLRVNGPEVIGLVVIVLMLLFLVGWISGHLDENPPRRSNQMASCYRCSKRCAGRIRCFYCGRGPMCLKCVCICLRPMAHAETREQQLSRRHRNLREQGAKP